MSDEQFPPRSAESATGGAPLRLAAPAEEVLAARLRLLGLSGVLGVQTHTNDNVMVSLTPKGILRVHRDYALAPDRILQAIVRFVARGRSRAVRLAARRILLSFPVSSTDSRPRRSGGRAARRPEDEPVVSRLEARWVELNQKHFDGALQPIAIELSARMRTRLGHLDYNHRTRRAARIALSRRMIARSSWSVVEDTLLHEMVHQWQAETDRPIDHGAEFRRKAREVGIEPRAVVDAVRTRRVAGTT